jgi:hypothetical protein
MASEKCRHCRWAAACHSSVYHEQRYRCEGCQRIWLARRVPRMLAVGGGVEWALVSPDGGVLAPPHVPWDGWLSQCPGCLANSTDIFFRRKHGENMIVRFRACGVAVCGMLETYVAHEIVYGSYRIEVKRE